MYDDHKRYENDGLYNEDTDYEDEYDADDSDYIVDDEDEDENVAIAPDHLAIEVAIDKLNASQATIAKAKAVFANMGVDGIFGRSDIAAITNDSVTAAGNLITKLKDADLIEPVSGFGKGKYKFVSPKA